MIIDTLFWNINFEEKLGIVLGKRSIDKSSWVAMREKTSRDSTSDLRLNSYLNYVRDNHSINSFLAPDKCTIMGGNWDKNTHHRRHLGF